MCDLCGGFHRGGCDTVGQIIHASLWMFVAMMILAYALAGGF